MVLRAAANTEVALSKIDFINKYGSISNKYSCVGPLGSPSIGVSIFIILTIAFAIGGGVLFSLKYTNNDSTSTTTDNNNNFKNNIAPILSYICFGIAGVFLIIYLIRIFGCYIGQHSQWLSQLPQAAINQLNLTRVAQAVLNVKAKRK